METRPLGTSDLEVSVVGLGCNNFGGRIDFERTRAVVDAALAAGVTFFDTADVYGESKSEQFLGELLEGRRDRVVLATKFGHEMPGGPDGPRGSRAYVHWAIDRSLERLRTDRIDLYYYHRPDGETPVAETLAAMQELVEMGKVRALGCSNFSAGQLSEAEVFALAEGKPGFVAVQNEYSLLQRDAERDVLPRARELNVGFIPYFPLASGLLTGKYRRDAPAPAGSRLEGRDDRLTDEAFARVEALEAFAAERGHSLLDLAIGALASTPGVASVISGATSAEQVRANAAAGSWTLGEADLAALAAA
jgi:aryl-alcohol dehydrogenase-like predicted oxidoreductase